MFHRIEGLYVAENTSFAELKGLLINLLNEFLEKDLKVRFRPSYSRSLSRVLKWISWMNAVAGSRFGLRYGASKCATSCRH